MCSVASQSVDRRQWREWCWQDGDVQTHYALHGCCGRRQHKLGVYCECNASLAVACFECLECCISLALEIMCNFSWSKKSSKQTPFSRRLEMRARCVTTTRRGLGSILVRCPRRGSRPDLHFDDAAHLAGASIETYLLEKSRLVSQAKGWLQCAMCSANVVKIKSNDK